MNDDIIRFVIRVHKQLKNYSQGEVAELLELLGLRSYIPDFGKILLTHREE